MLKLIHSIGETFECDVCSKKFNTRHSLKNHGMNAHDEENTCNICNKKFTHGQSLQRHEKTMHSHSVLSTSGDSFGVFDKGKRQKKHQPNRNPCNYCKKIFSSVYSLKYHIRDYHKLDQNNADLVHHQFIKVK